jgi:hypothetical protein
VVGVMRNQQDLVVVDVRLRPWLMVWRLELVSVAVVVDVVRNQQDLVVVDVVRNQSDLVAVVVDAMRNQQDLVVVDEMRSPNDLAVAQMVDATRSP